MMRTTERRSHIFTRRLRKQMTEAEVVLWTFLRERKLKGCKFRRQHPIGPYVADFACLSARLVVEVDGATHSTPDECEHDAQRTAFLASRGWRVLRVTNSDVFENMNGVWLTIEHWLPPPAASRPPPPQAGEETGASP
jgi:very-short-patch-repair endonuclease